MVSGCTTMNRRFTGLNPFEDTRKRTTLQWAVVGEGLQPSRRLAWTIATGTPVSTLYPRGNRLWPRNQAGGFETLPYELRSRSKDQNDSDPERIYGSSGCASPSGLPNGHRLSSSNSCCGYRPSSSGVCADSSSDGNRPSNLVCDGMSSP